ncbi:DUF6783 domain-containing protein [Clostridium sp. MCC353]|uniref:DUF6783 domain-containing protein n=1 Tax=Clostridium sp. MCC353 TaxID=2592646 RepID=UPI0031FE7013
MFENSFPSSARPTLREICPNSVNVARYASLVRNKSPTNCDAQLPESNFRTHSNIPYSSSASSQSHSPSHKCLPAPPLQRTPRSHRESSR